VQLLVPLFVGRLVRAWDPRRPEFIKGLAVEREMRARDVKRELVADQIAQGLARVYREVSHWPSVGRGQHRGKARRVVPIQFIPYAGAIRWRGDEFTIDRAALDNGASDLARWLERDVLNGLDAELERLAGDAAYHVGVYLDDRSPVGRARANAAERGVLALASGASTAQSALLQLVSVLRTHATTTALRAAASVERVLLRGHGEPSKADVMVLRRFVEREGISPAQLRRSVTDMAD
jgi:hypothetical protein